MLSPGEITVGMLITVLEWKERDVTYFPSIFSKNGVVTETKYKDRSYLGDRLKVIQVALPYVYVKHPYREKLICLDTRELDLMEIPEVPKEFA